MRVITGSARGRRLRELEGMETRPTTGKVKEGLFSAIQFEIEGRRVLDLFAGTGQLGIECLSRGAAAAIFIEHRRDAAALIRENLKCTGLEDRAKIVQGDAMDFLSITQEVFDLVLLDPPYASGLLPKALKCLTSQDLLRPGGIITAEHPAEQPPPPVPEPYSLQRTYRYGKIAVTLYRRK